MPTVETKEIRVDTIDLEMHTDRVVPWTADNADLNGWLSANGIDPPQESPSMVIVRDDVRARVESGIFWPLRRDNGWTEVRVPLTDALIRSADVVVLGILVGIEGPDGAHYGGARRLAATVVAELGSAYIELARAQVAAKLRDGYATQVAGK